MSIIDIHTHLFPDVPGSALVCVGIGPLPEDSEHYFSAGLHPWDVSGNDDDKFRMLDEMIANPRVLAVGECGFDVLKGPSHELQEQAFIRQIEMSEHFRKPMILHVVRDIDSIIRLRRELKPTQSWLIHGFRGGPVQVDQLFAQGILVSFGLKHNPESLKAVPSNRLILETDGHCPVGEVIQAASLLRSETPESVREQVIRNNNGFLLRY